MNGYLKRYSSEELIQELKSREYSNEELIDILCDGLNISIVGVDKIKDLFKEF